MKKKRARRITVNETLASKIYRAISDNVTDLRLIVAKGAVSMSDLDFQLSSLENEIWQEQVKILGVEP